jgi:hypothetical protein
VVGGAKECPGFGPLARRPEHRPAECVDAMEQDRQQQPMLDPVQIKQRSPSLEAQPHHAVIRLLEDWRVLLGCDRQAFADCIETPDDCCDRGECLAGGGRDTPALADVLGGA